jgi:hypothetical protein
MKSLVRRILFGNSPITEYSTVTVDGEIKEKVLLKTESENIDISANHYVLCLEPIVFGIWMEKLPEKFKPASGKRFQISIGGPTNQNELDKNPATLISVDWFDNIEEEDGTLVLLKLRANELRHIASYKISILFNRYYKKPGLTFEKFKSLVSAYSFPRKVRIVSFKQGDYFNIFPMDLVGMIDGGRRFVFGLRHTNITLSKIIESQKLVISEIPYTYKDIIYQLGKHHSLNPPFPGSLPFNVSKSKTFEFYFPDWAERYFEIKINRTKNLGSHMLLWGECINRVEINNGPGHLYHIHFLHHLYQKRKGYTYRLV